MHPARLLSLFCCLPLIAAADEVKILTGIPKNWDEAVKIGPATVLDTPEITTVRLDAKSPEKSDDEAATPIEFTIEWKNSTPKLETFSRTLDAGRNMTTSKHRSGMTSLLREMVYSPQNQAILIHLQANQPGALTLTTQFTGEGKSTGIDRLETLWHGNADQKARVWVIPFESEVTNRDGVQSIPGEGEALIILNSTGENTYKSLSDQFDPGHPHPNPWAIWQKFKETLTAE